MTDGLFISLSTATVLYARAIYFPSNNFYYVICANESIVTYSIKWHGTFLLLLLD